MKKTFVNTYIIINQHNIYLITHLTLQNKYQLIYIFYIHSSIFTLAYNVDCSTGV